MHKIATSPYHPNGDGGVERVNHTMAQMLAMVVCERQDDWGAHLPHVEFAYNDSVSAATGLAANEVHMNRLPRLPLTVFEHPFARGHQSLARDQLEYVDLAAQYCPHRTPKFCVVRRAQATPHLRRSWLRVDLKHCHYHPARGQSRHGRQGPQRETVAQLDGAIQEAARLLYLDLPKDMRDADAHIVSW